DARAGATHDLTALATSSIAEHLAGTEVTVLADKGYIGMKAKLGLAQAFTPRRRRRVDIRAQAVRDAEGEFNTELPRQPIHVDQPTPRVNRRRTLHGSRRRPDPPPAPTRACPALAPLPA